MHGNALYTAVDKTRTWFVGLGLALSRFEHKNSILLQLVHYTGSNNFDSVSKKKQRTCGSVEVPYNYRYRFLRFSYVEIITFGLLYI
jgi:hypothetical protein